ncbi:hypothetical protein PGTUg99_018360 [Puccinia graminis f. sp. tritici]|uniref:Uncharacterized protein n=1 Tax=Puccinia graminis f. sp. tritici TaxID=56615 RepID=A0A5B0SAT1_PUCGR|nr:hypothetical protein PGTUg99_018360 [Puccinia graminis f. sp. tritici]
MWIGLCTLPLLFLSTGVKGAYSPDPMDLCLKNFSYEHCVEQNAPNCKDIKEEDFKDCCSNGTPTKSCGTPNYIYGGCGSVPLVEYANCIDTHEPGCKGVKLKDYFRCCKGGPGHKYKDKSC